MEDRPAKRASGSGARRTPDVPAARAVRNPAASPDPRRPADIKRLTLADRVNLAREWVLHEQGTDPKLAKHWRLITPVMVAAIALAAVAFRSVPGPYPVIATLISVLMAWASELARKLEQRMAGRTAPGLISVAILVAVPMLLFGSAVVIWAGEPNGPSWDACIGILAVVSTIASILLHSRLLASGSALQGLWTGAAIGGGGRASLAVTIAAMPVVALFVIRQLANDRLLQASRREVERSRLRAQGIVTDYEQTGHGWFWETDRRGKISYVSETVATTLGCDTAQLVGRPFTDLFILEGSESTSERTLAFHISARSSFSDLAVRAASAKEERWWSISGLPRYDSFDNFVGFRGFGSDLTEKRRSAEQASRLAHFDSLTGLANRFQMSQTLEKILAAPRAEDRSCAVLLLDLDRFKQVNDTMGHPVGDALLKQVAQRLERAVEERGRVGRLGGDEFQVILAGTVERTHLAQLATRIIESLSQPYLLESHRVVIGASIGIAVSPDDGVTSEALIRNADLALYAAKDAGRGRHHFYAPDLHSDAEARRKLEHDLRDAIAQGDLELYYQPVVHTMSERISGFEALLRWNHPVYGPMSPAKFIEVAEDTGLIAQIGEWAIRTACRDLAAWPESIKVAVNVSPLQFANPGLPALLTSALAFAQVAPQRLELEITESVFLNDDESVEAMFAALKRVGVRLALDDFGTGYSSLGYLKRAPFDRIKIDQSFVRGATMPGSRNGAIISSIVSLAEALGMETTAEGVETLDELDLIRMLGCSHVQGYIYEKPMTREQATLRLAQGLLAIPDGPRAARAARQSMLRKVVLEHAGEQYHGTIRNISPSGALVEGLWNVPPGTIFNVPLAEGQTVTATCRWCVDNRLGIEFSAALHLDEAGRLLRAPSAREPVQLLRQAG